MDTMGLRQRFEWCGIRFGVPAGWDVVLVDNGALAVGPRGQTLTIVRRAELLERVQARWDDDLERHQAAILSDQRVSNPVEGRLRVVAVGHFHRARIMTQVFFGGPDTVTASYAADAHHSYDRREADDVIRSIRVKQSVAS